MPEKRLIDADDFKDLMYVRCAGQDKAFVEAMEQVIEDCPTVQPEVRRGKWIEYETSSYNGIDDNGEVKWIPKKFFRCSICRKGTAVRSNFCPNCGAKMDGGNENA